MNPSLFMKYTKIRLQSGQSVVVTVGGESMVPVLHNGDQVVVTRREKYAVGDILMYDYKEEGTLLHRLLEIRDGHFFCKGDNSYRLEEVTEADIYGVAIAVVRDGKEVPLVCPEGLPQSSLAVHHHLKELGLNLEALHISELYQAYKKRYLSEEENE